jgi:hypothetical protein
LHHHGRCHRVIRVELREALHHRIGETAMLTLRILLRTMSRPIATGTTAATARSFKGTVLRYSVPCVFLALESLVVRPFSVGEIVPGSGRGIEARVRLRDGLGKLVLRSCHWSSWLGAELGKELVHKWLGIYFVSAEEKKMSTTSSVKRTFSQEIFQVLDRGLFDFVIWRIRPDKREHVVC